MGQTTLNQKTSDFGTFGRYTEIPVDQMTSEQRKGYELVVQERGEARDHTRSSFKIPTCCRCSFLSESTFNKAILRSRTRNAKLW